MIYFPMTDSALSSNFFRKPLGLVLSGGGALGSWQAGALAALDKNLNLSFDSVVGFSAGALNGAAFVLGAIETAVERWKNTRHKKILTFSPRLFPFSIFSGDPIEAEVDYAADENEAQKKLRTKLTLLTTFKDKSRRASCVFEPQGKWGGPLLKWMVASSSIPTIFPPVRLEYEGKEALFVDAGVPCQEPMSFKALAGCQDVIVLEMVRSDEPSRNPSGFWNKVDHKNRLGVRGFIDQGVASLRELNPVPRIFRLAPSRALEFAMLNFLSPEIPEAIAMGHADACALIESPEKFLLPS